MKTRWAMLAAALMFTMGCQTPDAPKKASADDATTLQSSLKGFHKNMRWSRFDEASLQVSEGYKQQFLGRYEEMGDDLHIISLEVKKVAFASEKGARLAVVELEQQWYKEPNMTVKKDKLVERWERTGEGWLLIERLGKKEWRERKDKERKAAKEAKEAKEADVPPAATPPATPPAATPPSS